MKLTSRMLCFAVAGLTLVLADNAMAACSTDCSARVQALQKQQQSLKAMMQGIDDMIAAIHCSDEGVSPTPDDGGTSPDPTADNSTTTPAPTADNSTTTPTPTPVNNVVSYTPAQKAYQKALEERAVYNEAWARYRKLYSERAIENERQRKACHAEIDRFYKMKIAGKVSAEEALVVRKREVKKLKELQEQATAIALKAKVDSGLNTFKEPMRGRELNKLKKAAEDSIK